MKFYDPEYDRIVSERVPIHQYLYFSSGGLTGKAGYMKISYLQFLKKNFWLEDQKPMTDVDERIKSSLEVRNIIKKRLSVLGIDMNSEFIKLSESEVSVSCEFECDSEGDAELILKSLISGELRKSRFYTIRDTLNNCVKLYFKIQHGN